MIWTILALILWVILGGFISYYGDLQGRRWGKRRVSWLGLRPKHTAILITSVTGSVIALASVLSLMIIAPAVRDVILRGASAIQENEKLISSQRAQQLADKLQREKDARDSQQMQAVNRMKLAAGQKALDELHVELQAARNSLKPLQDQVRTMQAQVAMLTSQQHTLKHSNQELARENKTGEYINGELGKQNLALGHRNDELGKVNLTLEAANKTLQGENGNLTKLGATLRASNDEFHKDEVVLGATNDALRKENSELTHDKQEAVNLIGQRDLLYSQIQALSQEIILRYQDLRRSRVSLRAGVELSRLSIDAHLRPDAVRREVTALLTSASDAAKKYGAEADDSGRAARLITQPEMTLHGYQDRDEKSQIDLLANEWAGQDTSEVVVATTVTNCLAGEPVYVDLKQYPVVRVYAKGAEVASRTIDGHASVDSILNELMAFLQKDVKQAALRAGTIPRIDPETGASEVGVLGEAELFRLTDRVRRMRGPVLLVARAKQDLSSADSLNLTFHVSRLPSPEQGVAAQ